MSAEKVALGRRLFFDPRLSGNGTQSCASCHQPARAFTDGRAHAVGATGQSHARGAMSLANVAFSSTLTWADPKVRTLEAQARVPMRNRHPVEMGAAGREREILARLRAESVYTDLFPRAFPGERDPVTLANVRKAIASFERTLLSGDSPYDRLVWRDDRAALSDSARRGMTLFFSERLACSRCHSGFTLSGPAVWSGGPDAKPDFPRNGLGAGAGGDPGLFRVSRRPGDRGRFRAPTLRNVAVTGPYMHDGRFATLSEVVDHYARPGAGARPESRLPRAPSLRDEEKRDLVAFLESLTDEGFLVNPAFSNPWGHPERPLDAGGRE